MEWSWVPWECGYERGKVGMYMCGMGTGTV